MNNLEDMGIKFWRREIKFSSQNCEETGLGDGQLTEGDLLFLEEQAHRLLKGVEYYRMGLSHHD